MLELNGSPLGGQKLALAQDPIDPLRIRSHGLEWQDVGALRLRGQDLRAQPHLRRWALRGDPACCGREAWEARRVGHRLAALSVTRAPSGLATAAMRSWLRSTPREAGTTASGLSAGPGE